MKSLAIAALLGFVTCSQVKIQQQEIVGHHKRMAILNNLIQIENGQIDLSESIYDDSNVQLQQKHSFDVDFEETGSHMDGFDGFGGYKRETPDRFEEERDDRLMNSIINNYSQEIKINGKQTGHLFSNLNDAKALCAEVERTHQEKMGYQENPEKKTVEDVFNHFDVNQDGLIEVERMPQFLRYMYPNGGLDIDLQ